MINIIEFVNTIFVVHLLVYWGLGLLFLYFDDNNLFSRYKVEKLDKTKIPDVKVGIKVLLNQLLIIPISIMAFPYFSFKDSSGSFKNENLIKDLIFLFPYLLIFYRFEEIGFYYSHRLLHTKLFYKFHKIHHLWIQPIALSALYCHPIEFIISNIIPSLFGPLIMSNYPFYYYVIWNILATSSAVYSHSGYKFSSSSEYPFHYLHHKLGNVNFGISSTFLDRFHGTYMNKIKNL